jgi:hypothetical protein
MISAAERREQDMIGYLNFAEARGETRGIEIGEARGEARSRLEVARTALREGLPLETVQIITGIDPATLTKLQRQV